MLDEQYSIVNLTITTTNLYNEHCYGCGTTKHRTVVCI